MHPRNRMFILAALVYALLGGLIGVLWLAHPGLIPGNVPRIHGHLMLLGFVIMMIYGVGLHVLPRFSGRSLFSERLAHVQFVLANVGLWVMIAGWMMFHNPTVAVGGAMAWGAMILFALNIALTVRHYGPKGA
ncbi:conserved hypothetical protein [Thioalkalivibrio sp. K90mix]|uniref:hypothetical protein n=1 Tax=Thioalkalivibrio sp. (strain K90mix) TaxID=396595 RepID=UPI000195A751|nr:hypothetical protein [Thioalkalivibrio sp. K90mix]ADC72238.1 conserved hypothetical protein [Thioalkalivibrio sp. K90mix]